MHSQLLSIKDITLEIDKLSREEWVEYLIRFSDANLSQTWEFGEVRWGNKKVNRVVIRKAGKVIGMAQARIINIPLIDGGISYIHKGPVWKPLNEVPDKNNYRIILKMLRKYYVENNERLLIVVPNEIEFGNFEIKVILKEEGFEPMESQRKEQTIFIKLGNLDEIKAGMRRNWRKSLRDAENIGLDLILGTENEYLNISLSLYEQMHKRKRFHKITDMALLKKIHEILPPERKFKILICKVEGEAIGAMVWAEFGDTGYPLLAATGDKGLKYGCSYLLWWKMITTMTGNGMRWCDMGGIDPDGNPGGYVFKTGLSGKTGLNTTLFKQFNAMNGVKNHIIFRAAEAYKKNRCFIRSVYRNRFIL